MTCQRELILQELGKGVHHPTADELYERLRRKLPRISLATVYRNLEVLAAAGMIGKLEISGRQKRFDSDIRPHDHIYCVQCQRVDNINLEYAKQLPSQEGNTLNYEVTGYRVEFFGLCPECQKKMQKQEKGEQNMACKKKCGTGGLSEKQREVLEALAKCDSACGSKDIAAATSLEPKQVSCQITALKKKGYVASPARCKYEITEEGKKSLV